MEPERIRAAIDSIQAQSDLNLRALLLAALVSELFREHGFEPIVVGGSAIEFYTDGAYMSGDTDICWAGPRSPTPEQRGQIMSQLPGVVRKGTRSWKFAGVWIDLLGELESYGNGAPSVMETPTGEVVLLTVEELLVERVFAARRWTGFNEEDDQCAKKLLACILRDQIPCDWEETRRIARLPAYRCCEELEQTRREVEADLARGDGL